MMSVTARNMRETPQVSVAIEAARAPRLTRQYKGAIGKDHLIRDRGQARWVCIGSVIAGMKIAVK
jgi:hypothetical protein